MRRSIDTSSSAGKVVFFSLLVLVILGLFIYVHFFLPSHEHMSDKWIVETPVSCTEDGYRYKKCFLCGKGYDGEAITHEGHKPADDVHENVVAPTCTDRGSYEAVAYCTVCDTEINRVKVIVEPNGHTEDVPKKENETPATCTVAGSYDEVLYCKVCEAETSRQTKVDPIKEHTPGEAVVENRVEPTCNDNGSYEEVTYCTVCGGKLTTDVKSIPANGHTFEWSLGFENGDFSVSGKCTVENCTHEYDPEVDTDYTCVIVKNAEASIDATCVCGCDKYVATIYCKGVEIAKITLDVITDPVKNHELFGIDIMEYAQYDEYGNLYFNISTLGIVLVYDEDKGQNEYNVWDSQGFATGVYRCSGCDKWIIVRVYNDLA